MNVWYLHGLESKVGGPKVDFLSEEVDKVFAPKMNYNEPIMFTSLLKFAKHNRPDLIIGSSMGGYFADALGSHLDVEVLLFNPALHSRPMEPEGVTYGESNWKRNFVVGTEDTVIDPKATLVYKDIAKSYTEIKGMGHRTSLSVFMDIYNKWNQNQL
tara:strand:- start:2372 stop:2842 length:471 start_codon:yes stop_codon:yes gene_type:complete